MTSTDEAPAGERADLIDTLTKHRFFLKHTVSGIDDEQARRHTTVSELTLGGLIKHVSATERAWADFIVRGAQAMPDWNDPAALEGYVDQHRMLDGETLAGLLADYDAVAEQTSALIRELPDLDATHRLPDSPWSPPGIHWSARRVLLHLIAETAQHAGHADIIRESLDGQKTMG